MIPKFLGASGALMAAIGFLPAFAETCPPSADAPYAHLSLDQAVRQALESDLRPGAARAAVVTARAERAVAALRPSDTVSIEF